MFIYQLYITLFVKFYFDHLAEDVDGVLSGFGLE